jgi:transcriptional regulator with AAA-type ATPase domain
VEPIFANGSDFKKIKEQWLETSKTNLPLVIIGDRGVGKSFWIEKSISIRTKEDNYRLLKIDYSLKKAFFDNTIADLSKDNIVIVWWENLSSASDTEIKNWLNWWKKIKYELPKTWFLYWEIQTEEITKFRTIPGLEELYDSFQSFSFHIFPLNKRRSDIPFFITHFLTTANAELKKNVSSLDEQFHHFFSKRNFKHNLHDLRDLVYSLVAFSSKRHIKFNQIPDHLLESHSIKLNVIPGIALKDYEKEIINENLKYVKGNRIKAAKILGISERNLYRKIKEYQLEDES